MKILLTVDDFSGGAGNMIQLLANNLKKEGHQVSILLFNYKTEPLKLSSDIKYDYIDISKKSNNFWWLIKTLKSIREYLKQDNCQLIISFLDTINTLCTISNIGLRKKIIVCERNNPLAIKPKGFWKYLRNFAYFFADVITVQCEIFKQFLVVYKNKIRVIPNIVEEPRIKKNQYSNQINKFVSCARLNKVKQFDKMIESISIVSKKYPNITLDIYGPGTDEQIQELEKIITIKNLNDKVFLKGRSLNVYKDMIDKDIYLLTSKQEGFPNALCEAMAVGMPCISFEYHKGIYEIIQNGINGIVVDKDDVESMAEKIIYLIENPEKACEIGNEAKKISNTFSSEIVMKKWNEIIDGIC